MLLTTLIISLSIIYSIVFLTIQLRKQFNLILIVNYCYVILFEKIKVIKFCNFSYIYIYNIDKTILNVIFVGQKVIKKKTCDKSCLSFQKNKVTYVYTSLVIL